ncbi:Stp1/IreP family PP2C-type Ser/Thr phosphatase [Eubacteriales bacterium OttesenSCG-928-G02]|nr:Stp1/IreP family PP2C-type Ser/Thr phosphatase [Eubacteriales bacterium OttesenSCG-928-G02]
MYCLGKTDIGKKRKNNQDSYKIFKSRQYISAVVCDGMGGAKGGSVASTLAVNTYTKYIRGSLAKKSLNSFPAEEFEKILIEAVQEANRVVYERANADNTLEGMGTTLVGLLIINDNAICINVGDSRLYKLSEDKLEQITHDHSFVQFLLDSGSITKEEAAMHPNKNIILKAIGVNEHVDCDVFVINNFDGILLCTDGLTNLLQDNEIKNILNDNIETEIKLDILIDIANERGGMDNITVVYCDGKEYLNG